MVGLNVKQIYKECKGCAVEAKCYENYSMDLFHTYYTIRIGICPCKKCLVKMVCSNPCEEYSSLWKIQGQSYKD